MVLILGIYLCVLAVLAIGGIASYVLRGIGMYTIGKNRGMQNPWLAFIPYGRTYFQGELCGTIPLQNHEIKTPGLWMILIPIVTNILAGVFYVMLWGGIIIEIINYGGILSNLSGRGSIHGQYAVNGMFAGAGTALILICLILIMVFLLAGSAASCTLQVLVNRTIYSEVTHPNHATIHAVLGIFIPLYTSIYFFLIRNRGRKTEE